MDQIKAHVGVWLCLEIQLKTSSPGFRHVCEGVEEVRNHGSEMVGLLFHVINDLFKTHELQDTVSMREEI